MHPEIVVAVCAVIALAVTVVLRIKSSGRQEAGYELRLKHLEGVQAVSEQNHENHYRHERDSNVHWTSRERETLNDLLDKLDSKLDKLVDASAVRYGRRKGDE